MSHKALQNFASLKIGVNIGFSESECCEVTSAKWTEWRERCRVIWC